MNINEGYNEITQPDKFIKNFRTMQSFERWCNSGDIFDLTEALAVFEAFELYEHCAIIKKVIDVKSLAKV